MHRHHQCQHLLYTSVIRISTFHAPLSSVSAPSMHRYHKGHHLPCTVIVTVSTFHAPLSSGSAPSMHRYHNGQHLSCTARPIIRVSTLHVLLSSRSAPCHTPLSDHGQRLDLRHNLFKVSDHSIDLGTRERSIRLQS